MSTRVKTNIDPEGCLTYLLATIAIDLVDGLWFMWAVWVIHNHWLPAMPTIGYWWAVWLVVMARAIGLLRPARPSVKVTRE